jgi:hypothetical protein
MYSEYGVWVIFARSHSPQLFLMPYRTSSYRVVSFGLIWIEPTQLIPLHKSTTLPLTELTFGLQRTTSLESRGFH